MKRKLITIMAVLLSLALRAQSVSHDEMAKIYEEVKTPYKYGLVVAPADNYHKIDCPTVFRHDGKWVMTYVVYNGKDGNDGRGYETWMATSTDLLHWTTMGRLLSYKNKGWDMNQRGGFPSLIDWNWGGTYGINKYGNRWWMTYLGGEGRGYETAQKPLDIGLAWTRMNPSTAHEWGSLPRPILRHDEKKASWWEKLVLYKSNVYEDTALTLGHRFVLFYNAGGVNPANNLKAERIGIALSDDMTHWKRYEGNPVFSHEQPGIITGDAQIVRFPSSDGKPLFVMFYFSAFNPARSYWAYNTFAVSRDLVHWQDWDGADLIYPSKPYDNMFAHKSYVVKSEGVVYHFYCAVNKAGQRGIAVATSVPMGKSLVNFPAPEPTGVRKTVNLDSSWQAEILTANQPLARGRKKLTVNLPHNFDDYYGYRQMRHGNLHGTARYSRTFNVEKKQGKRYFITFEGIGTYATVTLNGHDYDRIGVGRTTYTLDITDNLRNGKNSIDVLVEHPEMITDMPWICGGCSAEWGFSEGSQPFGIFRNVSLTETAEQRVEPFGVYVRNNAACDTVFVETEIHNYSSEPATVQLVSKLNPKQGKALFRMTDSVSLGPNETKTVRQVARVSEPKLWSPDDPYLYTLATMVKDGKGTTIDQTDTEFGIRSISWPVHRNDNDGRFFINGKPFFINGTCDYEHLMGNSHAWTHEQIASRVKMMRQSGFNAFREAHQPHNLYYQQLLDEQGIPFWSQFSAHVWYDTPQFRANFKRLLRQWVKERRNSPSIVLWGLQNESVLPADFARECSDIIRDMDPTCRDQRAITTCNGGEGTDWNVVQNWSGTYGGNPNEYSHELVQRSQLLNGEYGAWRVLGLHGNQPRSEEKFTELLMLKTNQALSVKDKVCGQFQWAFVSHENPGRVQPDEALRRIDKVGPINSKGVFSIWEQPTEAFYAYRNHFIGENAKNAATAADRNVDLIKGASGYDYLYRVNCGGDAYTDSYNQLWAQDDSIYSHSWAQDFGLNPFMASQGHTHNVIRGTADPDLFNSFRWGRERLSYNFPLPDGKYRVELYFAEPWLGARYGEAIDCEGERLFDVAANGKVIARDVDPWAEGGFAGAVKRVADVNVEGGNLHISFPGGKAGEAVISAIAIARKHDGRTVAVPKHESYLASDFWLSLDTDTVAVLPKEILPADTEDRPAVRYKSNGPAKWTITPGVGQEYMLRFRYRNAADADAVGRLTLTDRQGQTLVDRPMTFPATPKKKFKTIGTTTGTQINAGTYTVEITGLQNVDFEYLEVQ